MSSFGRAYSLQQGEFRGTPAVKNLNLMQPSCVLMSAELLLCLEEEDYSSQEGKESKWCVCVIKVEETECVRAA